MRHLTLVILTLLASPLTTALAQNPQNRLTAADVRPGAGSPLFVIIYRPGPSWRAGKSIAEQQLGDHLAYYRRGVEQGRVFAGGALPAIDGGLAVLTVSSLDEAKDFLALDPAITSGVFVGEVLRWHLGVLSPGPLKR